MARFAGGCLCGALRWEADAPPIFMGNCYCTDCRKASGSGFVPFMGVPAKSLRFTGTPLHYLSAAEGGREARRNLCGVCGGLVFGGEIGVSDFHTIYAGSLDDASLFQPRIAIFNRSRPEWVPLPAGLTIYEAMPG
jgi:hypothetical protein